MKPGALIRLLRPTQWVKNGIVLMPVFFARKMCDPAIWLLAFSATACFCLAASTVYIFNDIRDREADRLHPRKKLRPIASGAVSPGAATVLCILTAIASLAWAWFMGPLVGILVSAYLVLQAAYSIELKRHVILDVMCIAGGFVLRAVTGAVAISVPPSSWLIICTFTMCLFMGFCKRRAELGVLEGDAVKHRKALAIYDTELLSHLITLSAGIAIISFLLYAVDEQTIAHFKVKYLVYTVPPVMYGVFRFAMLCMRGVYDDPTELVLRDRPLQMTIIVWGLMVAAIINWGPEIQLWLKQTLGE